MLENLQQEINSDVANTVEKIKKNLPTLTEGRLCQNLVLNSFHTVCGMAARGPDKSAQDIRLLKIASILLEAVLLASVPKNIDPKLFSQQVGKELDNILKELEQPLNLEHVIDIILGRKI